MTFQSNIPQAATLISVSQTDILNNFQKIGTVYPTDHVDFNASGAGYHKKITFLKPVSSPDVDAPASSFFTFPAPTTIISDLYYQVGPLASDVSQVTGGGITASAWAKFTVNGGVVNIEESYNISTIATTGPNTNITLTFTRAFAAATYVALLNAYQTGTGDMSNRKTNIVSQNTSNIVFNITLTSTGGISEVPIWMVCFFGKLS